MKQPHFKYYLDTCGGHSFIVADVRTGKIQRHRQNGEVVSSVYGPDSWKQFANGHDCCEHKTRQQFRDFKVLYPTTKA